MKSLLVLSSLVVVAIAQRPSYAGNRPIGLPDLASRFQSDDGSFQPVNNRLDSQGSIGRIPFWTKDSNNFRRREGPTQRYPQYPNNYNRWQPAFENRFGGANFDINAEIDDFGNPIRPSSRSGRGRFSGNLP